MKRTAPLSLFKYQAIFLATYIALAAVSLILTAGFSQHAEVVGSAIVPFAAWAALRSFVADQGRGLREAERRRMLANGLIQVAVLRLLCTLLTNGAADGSYLVVSVVLGTVFASLLLTFMYWSWSPASTASTGNRPFRH